MTSLPSPEPNTAYLAVATLATLAAVYACGWILLPRHLAASSKLLRSALIGTSGLLFLTGICAGLALHRLSYLTLIPMVQVALAGWSYLSNKRKPSADLPARDRWQKQDVLALILSVVVVTALFQYPLQRTLSDGTMRDVHSDLGFFVQQVMSIQDAGVANLWSPVLGDQTAAAGITQDLWYHWGSIFIAIGVTKTFQLPAINALLDVTGSVMDILLLLAASAIASLLIRGKTPWMLVVGALSLIATQTIKVPALLLWIDDLLPYGSFQHSKVTLALIFAYKYEGIIVLAALGAWLHRLNIVAILMLLFACISAPHTVAGCSVTGLAILVIGLALRHRTTWQAGLALVATPLAAWAAVTLLCGAEMAGGAKGIALMKVADLIEITKRGLIETGASLLISLLSLPGIVYFMRARDEEVTPHMRTLGWMAMGGITASCGAFHFLGRMADSFHVMLFVQTMLVMPLGIWGLARMMQHCSGPMRSIALAIIVASSLMGLHDLTLTRLAVVEGRWPTEDIAAAAKVIGGKPFGYFAAKDRGWWIPERSVMASMIDSRVARLNPIKDEQKKDASRYYGYTRPFELVAPQKGENAYSWSLRFAEKLGIRHVIEFPQEPLPPIIAAQAKLLLSLPSMKIYELMPQAAPQQ